jgi:hypothetical protein
MHIDPLRLAQFMVLPGAAELVEAFSAIPPGPVRDSVVNHAQVLAQASGWNPGALFTGEAITAREIPAHAPRLESPFAEGLAASTAEGRIIERALRGEADHAIAADLGVSLGLVVQLKRKARKEGGVVFPGDDKQPAKPKTKLAPGERLNSRGHRIPIAHPLPAPPWWWQDPESPVWNNGKLLPSHVSGYKGTMAAIGPNDSRAFATMKLAADRRGQTLAEYVALRQRIVDRILAGESVTTVSLDMRVTGFNVYGLMADVGHARGRQSGPRAAPVPNQPDHRETPPTAVPAPARHQSAAHRAAISAGIRTNAAKLWGFPDAEAYDRARVRVRDLRLAGKGLAEIATLLMVRAAFVKNTLAYWRHQGVSFALAETEAEAAAESTGALEPGQAAGGRPLSPKQRKMTETVHKNAARKWGYPSVEAYQAARNRVFELRMARYGILAISEYGFPIMFVKGTLDAFRDRGVKWPPVIRGAKVPKEASYAA